MKLIKINTDHYIVVDDSEIKEGDYSFYPPFGIGKNIIIDEELCFYIEPKNNKGSFTQRTYQTLDKNKKIICSTLPLESFEEFYKKHLYKPTGSFTEEDWCSSMWEHYRESELLLSEVEELIGEVDVEKKAEILYCFAFGGIGNLENSKKEHWIKGYNQALEDNKEKKYTEEDIHKALSWGYHAAKDETKGISSSGYGTRFIQSLQPKTEWEVEFENGKLRLV